jgi:hypothetical protein
MSRPTTSAPSSSLSSPIRQGLTRAGLAVGVLASGVATILVVAGIVDQLRSTSAAPWVLARASGFTSYVLMMALVLMGLLLSHPAGVRIRRLSRLTRMRIHVALAVFTLAFTVLHVVVLATDEFAGVGWRGALLPLASEYRPVPVTLGVIAVWSAMITALTASLAGRLAARVWWPVHKVAAIAFVLVWAHGVLAGSDTPVLMWFYLTTGLVVVVVGASRYTAKTPGDELAELVAPTDSAALTDLPTTRADRVRT